MYRTSPIMQASQNNIEHDKIKHYVIIIYQCDIQLYST